MPRKSIRRPTLPDKAELLRFIEEAPGEVGKREIARAFHITGDDRQALKAMLRELHADGLIQKGRRRVGGRTALPNVTVVEVAGADAEGWLKARPVSWSADEPPPEIVLPPQAVAGPALRDGDRLLVRLQKDGDRYEGRVVRRLAASPDRVLGLFRRTPDGGRILPTEKRLRYEYTVPKGADGGAEPGELVVADVEPGRRLGLREARVVERLGGMEGTRGLSLISIHTYELPTRFPAAAEAEAEAARPVRLSKRTDLRALPLVTIDGEDARDFDDAVFAERDDTAENEGGYRLVVAIADVAHYVRPNSALDREAQERGNSTYFPDRVVPMLPEALSNGLCSLKEGENRAVLAVEMRIDRYGNKLDHRFVRGLMRSAARLTYTQVQAAYEGVTDDRTGPLLEPVLRPLFGAYEAMIRARRARSPLDLNLPETRVLFDDAGAVAGLARRSQNDANRLIEEFMIAANVAAAETLEAVGQPCMYRVHGSPEREKLRSLKEFLETLDFSFTLGETVRPHLFNRVLDKARGTEFEEVVNLSILRAQTQAYYAPDNLGHFGLALPRYAHFTSPIRRYADLLVHRALIFGLGLGAGGLARDEAERFARLGEQISNCERRSMAAERDAMDRFVAAWMQDKVGATFAGRISGVTRAGLFIRLSEGGGDGLVPIAGLGREYFEYVEAEQALFGRETGLRFRLGDPVEVRLKEASPITGGMLLEITDGGIAGKPPGGRRRPRHKSGRPESAGRPQPRRKR